MLRPQVPRNLEVQIAVEKVSKYATGESGDTVEVVERPHGGISVVVADGQSSGRSAKAVSNIVVRKAISLLAEGVRDGAVARATHDYLLLQRGGRVSAELFIVSVDLVTQTLVLGRNARCPSLLRLDTEFVWFESESEAIGIHRNTKPDISELPLQAGMTLVVFTDGVWRAGGLIAPVIDLPHLIGLCDPQNEATAQVVADGILREAIRLDQGRPRDDATVAVIKIVDKRETDMIRRLSMRFPV